MSTLHLIRHGQASFGADNYDVLSPTGRTQARHLGTYWGSGARKVDAIYVGPRKRHLDTADEFRQAARDAGLDTPEPSVVDELDEYPAFELFRHWLPRLAQTDPELAEVAKNAFRSLDDAAKTVELISRRWASGELTDDTLESFESFEERVLSGINRIISEQGRGRTVVAVSSGGPISVAMRRALSLNPETTVRVAWAIHNASISDFQYRDSRQFALSVFNATPHLGDRALITRR